MIMFHKEENGVRWSSVSVGSNTTHTMEFAGHTLTGAWVGPQWIFHALTQLSPEELSQDRTHDEWMTVIHAHLRKESTS